MVFHMIYDDNYDDDFLPANNARDAPPAITAGFFSAYLIPSAN